jgi:hypothetical protein
MSFLRNIALAVPLITAGMASAESLDYGSFQYDPGLPRVLFLKGEIQDSDSFELRRAMRDQTIDLVVTASPGGSLYEGLQIAAILQDNRIGTYVPEGASCESSCANVFLGGFRRLVIGELGVHQFYTAGPSGAAPAPTDLTTARTQYTTADIIGIMNQFDTPPFVYEKMLGTTDIYYFKGSEKARLNREVDDADFTLRLAEVDAFLAQAPAFLERTPFSPDLATAAQSPAAVTPQSPPVLPTAEEAAVALLASINGDWSLQNEQALPRISAYYASGVDFYGNYLSHSDVMVEKETFARRWPIRDYQVEPGSVYVACTSQGCVVDSVITWAAASPERGAKASGRSAWKLILISSANGLKITGESGKTLKRN